jgi:dTDP-glucose 4,6-dehydratase
LRIVRVTASVRAQVSGVCVRYSEKWKHMVKRNYHRGELANQHVVVSGGAGFLGSHICDALLESGAFVTCLDNEATGAIGNVRHLLNRDTFTHRHCDVAEKLPKLNDVDIVLHMASVASPLAYARLPIETLKSGSAGTLNMLQLAAEHDARIVFTSTSEVYGDPEVHPQPESYWGHVNPIGPRAVYDESKRFGEAAVIGARQEWQVNAGIVRIFNTYGPRMAFDDGRVIPTFVHQAHRGEPLTVAGDGRQTRSLCYVDDTVRALLLMAQSSLEGPINIGHPEEHTVMEIARLVIELTDSSSSIVAIPLPQDDPLRRNPDISRARSELPWEPTIPLKDGLARTIAWYRERSGLTTAVNR